MLLFPKQCGYTVFDVHICFVEALQHLASQPIPEIFVPLSAKGLTFGVKNSYMMIGK